MTTVTLELRPRPDLRALLVHGPIHFMGAGGAGMCALAEAVHRGGGIVTACDRAHGAGTRALEALGVRVHVGHDPSHVEGVAALVLTAAIPEGNPELRRARELGIPILKRAEALGSWVSAGQVAAVAGTHGKTTTTAMLTGILIEAGLDPTGFVGGRVASWASHLRPGSEALFVVEADEYDRSFHQLHPDVTVVTNLEADHLDIYGDLEGVKTGFRTYVEGMRPGGQAWVCADDTGAASLLPGLGGAGHSYGFQPGAELRGVRPISSDQGGRVEVWERGTAMGEIRIRVPGLHNLRNALGAAGAARTLGVGWDSIRRGLAAFEGVGRRFQRIGSVRKIEVVDDYAHHPTEVTAALSAARSALSTRKQWGRGRGRLVAVFQPHLYTRTRDFHEAFGTALAAADVVWVTGIYPAREPPIEGVEAELIVLAARAAGATEVVQHEPLEGLAQAVAETLSPGDLCIVMGAGSVERVAPELMATLEGRGASPQSAEHGTAPTAGGADA